MGVYSSLQHFLLLGAAGASSNLMKAHVMNIKALSGSAAVLAIVGAVLMSPAQADPPKRPALPARPAIPQAPASETTELSAEEQRKIQRYMEQKDKAERGVSNAMKKSSESAAPIVTNMK